MTDQAIARAVDKIVLRRRWTEIAPDWLHAIPNIDPPGAQPEGPLSSLISFEAAAEAASSGVAPFLTEAPGFREAVLHEALFLLHKASHVTGLAQTQFCRGARTWSVSDAYHGSLFAAQSIMHFLGIALPEYHNHTVVVDCWPTLTLKKTKSKKPSHLSMASPSPLLRLVTLGKRVEHRHTWYVFQRLLRVASVEVWPRDLVVALTQLEPGDFANQRNLLHYHNDTWLFPDLFQFIGPCEFTTAIESLPSTIALSEGDDFSLAISLALLWMGHRLLSDIVSLTNRLSPDSELFAHRLSSENHPIYTSLL